MMDCFGKDLYSSHSMCMKSMCIRMSKGVGVNFKFLLWGRYQGWILEKKMQGEAGRFLGEVLQ